MMRRIRPIPTWIGWATSSYLSCKRTLDMLIEATQSKKSTKFNHLCGTVAKLSLNHASFAWKISPVASASSL